MKICILYDCLYPYTIGGAERWYQQLASAYVAAGHQVTYLTLCQWDRDNVPKIAGVEVIAVGPRMTLYVDGKRRIVPPLVFGWGVLWHLLRYGRRYDLVHGASFPFFSVLAAGLLRPFCGFRIAIDWHEVWTRKYWRQYLGPLGGVGWLVQRVCARVQHVAFSFSRLHGGRAEALGTGSVTVLEGEYDGPSGEYAQPDQPPFVLYAGRMIPEKRVPLLVDALAELMRDRPELRAELIGRGPDLDIVKRRIEAYGLSARIALPGFVETDFLEDRQRRAAVVVQPSEREGYGMVVVEAAARGVPIVVVAGADNAAVELIQPGINGFVAARGTPVDLAVAIGKALDGGELLRDSVARWHAQNLERLSFSRSFERIVARVATDLKDVA